MSLSSKQITAKIVQKEQALSKRQSEAATLKEEIRYLKQMNKEAKASEKSRW